VVDLPCTDCLCFIFSCIFFPSLCRIPLNDYKLLVCDIQQMLVAVTIHSCSSSGSQYFRIIEDLITLLGFMQTSKTRRTQGEQWVSEIQYKCKIHQSCCLCSTVVDDIKLSGSAAGEEAGKSLLYLQRQSWKTVEKHIIHISHFYLVSKWLSLIFLEICFLKIYICPLFLT